MGKNVFFIGGCQMCGLWAARDEQPIRPTAIHPCITSASGTQGGTVVKTQPVCTAQNVLCMQITHLHVRPEIHVTT